MNIFYFSCHAVLEYDEVKLLHELGYDVFSAGAYSNPIGHPSLPRPGIDGLKHYPELERAASTIRSTGGAIPDEIIDWADTIIFMHEPDILQKNWQKLKHKRVIFRSIGQCVTHQEENLKQLVAEGLSIIRYSPKEKNIPGFAGEDAMIRFYKDPEEFNNYTGEDKILINITQSATQRSGFVLYDQLKETLEGYPHKIYGLGNEDLGEKWGGDTTYDELKHVLRRSRALVYTGTWPASYTLSFIEAMMTGIPIIAAGPNMANKRYERFEYYEPSDIIENGKNGFYSDYVSELREYARGLLENHQFAKEIGAAGRKTAIELFGKERIKAQWSDFIG